ncbi:flagellar biosynthetic protein FliO [Peribacillus sp. B-H-3]|uniref:flagellar biosynthetic protein FliO n=1 Tax=Peribacillus sp. B-H-3 TaxID=3400420 RepID=UPI003B02B818
MAFITKITFALLLLFAAPITSADFAHASSLDKSVKDAYAKPNDDQGNSKKETAKESANLSAGSAGLTFMDFLRVILATIFVVALLYLLLRFMNKKSKAYQKANFIENLGGASLGSNRSVQLIKVGGRMLVVGVGENIQLLKEIDDQAEYQEILDNYNGRMDHLLQPADILSKLKKKMGSKKNEGSGESSFSLRLKEQLAEMSESRKKTFKEMEKKGRDTE